MKSLGLCFILLLFSCNFSDKKAEKSTNTANKTSTSVNNSNAEIEETKDVSQDFTKGQEIYNDFCMQCHRPDGKGVKGAFPPLADSDYLKEKRVESIKAIKYGLSGEITVNGVKYNTPMASQGLSDMEVADVMNFITNSWGNKNTTLITEEEVSKIER